MNNNTIRVGVIGADATIHAAMRADKLLAQGDLDGAGTWRRSSAVSIEGKQT